MPVDADAYMAGAIPTLSRGGSWLPDRGTSAPPGSLPPGTHSHGTGSSNFGGASSVLGSPSPHFPFPQTPDTPRLSPGLRPSVTGSGVPFPLYTPRATWSASPTEYFPSPRIDDKHSFDRYKSESRSKTSFLYLNHPNPAKHREPYFDNHLPADGGHEWEAQGGSPKFTSPEPEYRLRKGRSARVAHPPEPCQIPSRPSSPGSPYRKLHSEEVFPPDPPSPYHRLVTHLRPPSPPQSKHARPPIQRRHTATPHILSPKPRGHHEPDLTRSAQLNSRLARLSLQGRECHTPDPESSPKLPSPLSPTRSAHPSVESTASSMPNSKVRPIQHKVVDQLRRTRHLSTPQPSGPERGRSAMHDPVHKTHSQKTDRSFVEPVPTNSTHNRHHIPRRSSVDFPRTRSHSSASNQEGTVHAQHRTPPGYISPLGDDLYDRYSPHPAAPVPEWMERQLRTSHSQPSLSKRSPSSTTKQEDYIPIGYARPVKELAWNRTGPAMKTYGIAWLREGEAESLPEGPKGPRWEVARPPRAEQVQGGGWWQSGADGTSAGR
ncbi:hypothetical protein CI109_104202 [Kwoniella shandongensis]|uniref:Uncharacterized protein n=1 Tax=Kwoniella shandongensis TaxID=1734106 RepID=A0A5M6C6C7_9TREE|nr:uncharacterized protein CI109_002887 [Kwoniella shandongensis]KAA5528729.1 hypothetical protein CI109_002887 [Kwoniella shandongensis]